MEYTAEGLLTRFADPKGQANTFEYDALGRLTKDLNAGGGGWTVTTAEHASGYTTHMTTGEGRTTGFSVDYLSTGDRNQTNTYPDGTVPTRLFKTSLYEEITTAPDGTVTRLLEGPDPRFGMQSPVPASLTVTLPSGLSVSTTRTRTASLGDPTDPLSLTRLAESRAINGKTYQSQFDAASLSFTATSPLGRTVTTTVNPQARPVKRVVPGLAEVVLTYDTRGRLVTTTQGKGLDARWMSLSYFGSGPRQGYLESLTDALGRTVEYDYDLAGRVTRKTLPDGREVRYEYDANGNLTALHPPGQPPHLFDYTALDLEALYTPPDLGQGDPATRYVYNRDKDLLSVTRPDGQRLEFTYDSGGRLSTLTAPHGDYTYGYHAATGQLSTLTAPDGGTLSYGGDGFLTTESSWAGAITGSVNRKYNRDFRITELAVNGSPIPFGYDADGLVIQAGALALTRNAGHGLLTGTALGGLTERYTYNGFGEVTDYGAEFNAAPLFTTAYTRDGLGRITEKTETLGGVISAHAYTYDRAGRLTEVKQNGVGLAIYRYDENGNRTHVNDVEVAHYDAQDRLLDYQGTTYIHSRNGELASKTEGAFTTTYAYDVLGNLRSVNLPNGSRIDYLIDGQNRRIGKKVNGTLVRGFLYQDQLHPIAELDGSNQVVSRFVYADKPNVPAYLVKNGTTYRIVSDHLGSPRFVVNADTGDIVQRMDYDEWGKVTLDTNAGFQPFGFAGGLYDRDTKLVRFGARDYDPETGRWTAKDPIRFVGGDTNLYGYVLNDPVNLRDPLGLMYTDGENRPSTVIGTIIDNILPGQSDPYHNDSDDGESPQDKKLSPREEKALKDKNIDIHALKGKGGSKLDLFKRPNGNICVKPKDGSGPGEDTGLNINDF